MTRAFHLFDRFGVELEYALVRRDTLDVLPAADELIKSVCGRYEGEIEQGPLNWSNELVLHVIELKTGGPAPALEPLAAQFQEHVGRINALLEPLGGRLMPGAMHPWMSPEREMRLWPHDYNAVYAAFDRIFDCRGHGWSNLQSVHLNLPFADDAEFARLHAAIRLVLPILPALAASSPIAEGRLTGFADTRLAQYRQNSRRIPSVAGRIIPEPVYSQRAYEEEILARAYRDIAPYDPEGTLQHEWLNARGAIARFERNTIEIRLLDIQECPAADLAILALVVATLQALVDERTCGLAEQQGWAVEPLAGILEATIRDAEEARIDDAWYLRVFGLERDACTAGQLWAHLYDAVLPATWRTQFGAPLRTILEFGPLSRRIVTALAGDTSRARLTAVYGELCACLAEGRMLGGEVKT